MMEEFRKLLYIAVEFQLKSAVASVCGQGRTGLVSLGELYNARCVVRISWFETNL